MAIRIHIETEANYVKSFLGTTLYPIFQPIIENVEINMVLQGLAGGLGQISYVVLLLFLLLYIYTIAGMIFFIENDFWHFRSIEISMLMLLRVLTFDVGNTGIIIYIFFFNNYDYFPSFHDD